MFSFNFVSVELGSLIEIASGLLYSRRNFDRSDRQKVRLLLSAVRTLYADDPTIQSLREFADGAAKTKVEVGTGSLQLHVSEKSVSDSLEAIRTLADRSNLLIPLEAIEHLKGTMGGKAGLRFELTLFVGSLWHALESNDTALIDSARKQARIVIQMIDQFNGQLQALDSSLREEGLNDG